MPDRLPPNWGHEPEDGRDLESLLPPQASLSVEEILTDEALLAGQLAGISDSQRPVAGTMFALRSAPAGSELAGEARARAAYRALLNPAGPMPAGAGLAGIGLAGTGLANWVPAGQDAAWSLSDPGGAEAQHTLVLPVQLPGQGQVHVPRPPARHRRPRRPAGRRVGWQVMAFAGTAAAAVAVAAVALTGALSGSGAPSGQSANPSAAQLSNHPGASPTGAQRVMGGGQATQYPTRRAAPKASASPGTVPSQAASPSAADLCRQYFALFFNHSQGDRSKEKELYDELSQLAGSKHVFGYCMQQLPPYPRPTSTGGTGAPYPGSGEGPGSGAETRQAGTGQPTSGPGDSGPGDSGQGFGGPR